MGISFSFSLFIIFWKWNLQIEPNQFIDAICAIRTSLKFLFKSLHLRTKAGIIYYNIDNTLHFFFQENECFRLFRRNTQTKPNCYANLCSMIIRSHLHGACHIFNFQRNQQTRKENEREKERSISCTWSTALVTILHCIVSYVCTNLVHVRHVN